LYLLRILRYIVETGYLTNDLAARLEDEPVTLLSRGRGTLQWCS